MTNFKNLTPEQLKWMYIIHEHNAKQGAKQEKLSPVKQIEPQELTPEDYGLTPDTPVQDILDAIGKIGFM